jgi:hypothetical protein
MPASRLWYLTGPVVTIGAPVVTDKTGKAIEPLSAELMPFLDWPVWMREDGVTCERDDCQHQDCQNAGWGPVQVSESGHTTLRKILEGLKQHGTSDA